MGDHRRVVGTGSGTAPRLPRPAVALAALVVTALRGAGCGWGSCGGCDDRLAAFSDFGVRVRACLAR